MSTDAKHLRELRSFFQDHRHDCMTAHALYALESHKLPARVSVTLGPLGHKLIGQHRRVMLRLRAINHDHADVLAWAFEVRVHPPAVLNALGEWPSVALRTMAARESLLAAESPARIGDLRHVRPGSDAFGGMVAHLTGLPASSPLLAAVRLESARRVRAALEAYARCGA